jgi:hypothetical protein
VIGVKKSFLAMLILVLFLSLALAGRAQQKATSSKEAIETAKATEAVKREPVYLLKQAWLYQLKGISASYTSQYILRYLDNDSQAAEGLIEQARDVLVSAGECTAEYTKGEL